MLIHEVAQKQGRRVVRPAGCGDLSLIGCPATIAAKLKSRGEEMVFDNYGTYHHRRKMQPPHF
jgi:hypothetical protein